MKKRTKRISTEGGEKLSQNPFDALTGGIGPSARNAGAEASVSAGKGAVRSSNSGSRRRVEIRREKAGRGGKTVTTIAGLERVELRLRREWVRRLQRELGTGGAVKDGKIELQGDHREEAAAFFAREGFRPVFAGG